MSDMTLETNQLTLQLERIEQIQQQIHDELVEDTLKSIEELLAEKKSRLTTIIRSGVLNNGVTDTEREHLAQILKRDLALEAVIKQKLAIVGNKLRKTKAARQGVGQYAFATAHLSAQLLTSTDLTG